MTKAMAAMLLLNALLMCTGATMQREYRSSIAPVSSGITADEISASFLRIAARYRHRSNRLDTAKINHVSDQSETLFDANALQSYLTALTDDDTKTSDRWLGPSPFSASLMQKRGTIVPLIPVGGYPVMLGSTYNVQIGIGTPVQHFRLTVDTGSTLTWAVLASCSVNVCPDSVVKKAKYSPKASSTAVFLRAAGNDHEAYGDGEADFNLYRDTVTFLSPSGRRAKASKTSSLILTDSTIGGGTKTFPGDAKLDHDGLLGLGRKRKDSEAKPIFDRPEALPLAVALQFGQDAAQLEIGGFDAVRFPNMSYFKLPPNEGEDSWMVTNVSLSDGPQSQSSAMDMLVDSGSSVVIAPQSVVDQIMNKAGMGAVTSDRHTEPTIYSLPCTAKLGLQFVLADGRTVDLADETLLMKSNDATLPGDCLSMIVGTTNPFLPSVAGVPILKNLYTVLVTGAPDQYGQERSDWIALSSLAEKLNHV